MNNLIGKYESGYNGKVEKILRYKLAIFTGVFIILLYFVLRTVNLTILPIFVDEAIYIRWAQVMRNEPTLRFLPLSDGKQPLFMWSIIPFFKIFSDPLVAGRMVSVVTGFGTLVGIFLLTFYLFKRVWLALIAAAIYTVSPFAVFFDRMALVDSMLTMFGVWVLLLGVLMARKLRLDFAMLAGFGLGGGLLTKSPALFYSLLLPTTIIFAPIIGRAERLNVAWTKIIKFMGLLLVIYIIGYGMYNILRLGPNFNLIGARNQDYVFPLSHLFTDPKDPFIFHIDRAREWLLILGPAGLLVLVIAGFFVGLRFYKKETLILMIWAIFPIFVQSEFAKVFTARYILFSLPPLIIMASLLFSIRRKFVRPALLLGLAWFVGQALLIDYYLVTAPQKAPLPQSERSGYLEEWTAGIGIREVAQFIKERKSKNPDERVVIGTEGFFGTLPDGLQIYLSDVPQTTVIGVGITITKVPEELKNAKRAGDTVYLVVNSSRMLAKFETDATIAGEKGKKMGLEVVASYPKAKRARTDTHEYVWHGERDYLYLFEVTENAVNEFED